MKHAKGLLIVLCLGGIVVAAGRFAGHNTVFLISLFPLSVLLFNLAVRKRLSMKNFLLHPANLLTSKLHQSFEVDMPADLLFEKMKEVVAESKFRLAATDPERLTLLATVPMSVWSWGENIYITIEPRAGMSLVNVSSVAFQVYAWGRNEAHFKNIVNNLEESLTI
jgi:hypothetical protein